MSRLRDLREDHDLLQKEVAAILKVTQQHYSRIEIGVNELTIEQLRILAEYYNVSADYILGLIQRPRALHEYKDNLYSRLP